MQYGRARDYSLAIWINDVAFVPKMYNWTMSHSDSLLLFQLYLPTIQVEFSAKCQGRHMAFRSFLLKQQCIRNLTSAQPFWTKPHANPLALLPRRPMTTSTGRDPKKVLAPDDGEDDTWLPNWKHPDLHIKRAFRQLGHKHWGFTVYRCTYGDDGAWEQLMTRLYRCVSENLQSSGVEDLTELLDMTVHEDAELDGASKDVARKRFQKWLATEANEERLNNDAAPVFIESYGRKVGTTPRYQYCLHVDEEALRSVVPHDTAISDEEIDAGVGYLNLIDARWTLPSEEECEGSRREHKVEDQYDEGFEAVDGYKMQDVGWMRVGIRTAMPDFYSRRLVADWEHDYVRPPGVYY